MEAQETIVKKCAEAMHWLITKAVGTELSARSYNIIQYWKENPQVLHSLPLTYLNILNDFLTVKKVLEIVKEMKTPMPKEAYWTTELLFYYIDKRFPGKYNWYYLIQEQDEDPRTNKHLLSKVHLVNISFQQKTDIHVRDTQNICLLKIPGIEHVFSVVGYHDPKTGENDLGAMLANLRRARAVSFYPGIACLKFLI